MASFRRWFGVPRPKTFLYCMSLRTGTEMISLTMIFNKITGFFGLLAVLTGFSLSPLQFSMYMYSVAAVVLLAILFPHIRKQTPFECLVLGWFYLIDTLVNTAFTAAFGVTWFLAVSTNNSRSFIPSNVPGIDLIDEAAGFKSSKHNMTKVEGTTGQGAAHAVESRGSPSIANAAGVSETLPSIIVIAFFTIIRIYFILVTMAYARQVLRQALHNTPSAKIINADGTTSIRTEVLFAPNTPQGQGWRGRLGRAMVSLGGSYWQGGQLDDSWARGLDNRFKTAAPTLSGPPGTIERERRARSGTGPPPPPSGLMSKGLPK